MKCKDSSWPGRWIRGTLKSFCAGRSTRRRRRPKPRDSMQRRDGTPLVPGFSPQWSKSHTHPLPLAMRGSKASLPWGCLCFVNARRGNSADRRLLHAGGGLLPLFPFFSLFPVYRHIVGLCDLLNHLEVLGDYSGALLRGLFDVRILRRLGCVFELSQVLFMVFHHGLDVGFIKLLSGEPFELRHEFLIFF